MNTTGGTYAHGTAYPVQLTGSLSEVYITNNTVLSYSNGPILEYIPKTLPDPLVWSLMEILFLSLVWQEVINGLW